MQAVEFYAKIDNGKIAIPARYRDEFQSNVKVILLKPMNKTPTYAVRGEGVALGFGALSHRANPNLWAHEENAWERAVSEKYGSD